MRAALPLVVLLLAACSPSDAPPKPVHGDYRDTIALNEWEYKKNPAAVRAEVDKLFTEGKFKEAYDRGRPFARFGDQALKATVDKAEAILNEARKKAGVAALAARIKELHAVVKKPENKSQHARMLLWYSELERIDPANLKTYRAEWTKHRLAQDRIEAQDRQRALATEKAARRKLGVNVGMTESEVLMSSWGRPRTVNSTTTARGTTQQWVYDGGYLYFGEDGKLRAIQN